MVCIVALGNPGEEYARTRHNVGWMVLDAIIETRTLPTKVSSGKYASMYTSSRLFERDVCMLFPTTFMNNSGTSVKKYIQEQGTPEMLIAIHDEIDLPFGAVRISFDRGAGGHNGVKSLIDAVGSQFVRVRVGIGHRNMLGMIKRPKGDALSKFVLGEFKSGELKEIPEVAQKVDRALELLITKGLETAMQEVNKG